MVEWLSSKEHTTVRFLSTRSSLGLLAHLGERHACTVEAFGAEPTGSTKQPEMMVRIHLSKVSIMRISYRGRTPALVRWRMLTKRKVARM